MITQILLGAAGSDFEVMYVGDGTESGSTDGSLSSRTITDVPLGDFKNSRISIIAVKWNSSSGQVSSLSSATIGGVSATIINQVRDAGSSYATYVAYIYAIVPTLTYADIVLNFDSVTVGAFVAPYAGYNRNVLSIKQSDEIADRTITFNLSSGDYLLVSGTMNAGTLVPTGITVNSTSSWQNGNSFSGFEKITASGSKTVSYAGGSVTAIAGVVL